MDDIYDIIARASPVKQDGPRGWIQWKGTDVCCDIHCECGELMHVDAEFAYAVRCTNCERVYGMDPNITLVPLDPESTDYWVKNAVNAF